jgi:hypothetical protein
MKTNLINWLCGLCATLLFAVLGFQFKQQGRLDALQQQQESLSSALGQQRQQQRELAGGLANQFTNLGVGLESRLTQSEQQAREKAAEVANSIQQLTSALGQQRQEQHDALAKLSDRVLTLGTNWEATLTPRLNAKSDELVARFSTRLNEKSAEAATQVANVIRLQAETALKAAAVERSNKTARLLEAAGRYEKDSPELAELCYLSAFKTSDGNAGQVLKPFLAWQERKFNALTEDEVLATGSVKLMGLYAALDKALPDSMASPEDVEKALSTSEKVRKQITERQQARIRELHGSLTWNQFDPARRSAYEQARDTLTSFSPANKALEGNRDELLQVADTLIQTAVAMNSVAVAELLPPSPKAPSQVVTNWFNRGLELVRTPTNTIEARLTGLSVLIEFARQHGDKAEYNHYADALTNESVKLASSQWVGRVEEYERLSDKKEKPEADTIALGQSLLNQGFAMLKAFTNKTLTAEVSTALPRLAANLSLQRELLLVGQMRLVDAPNAFSSKEQTARARSLLYGQALSAIVDLRTLQGEVAKECGADPERLVTLKHIEGRFREYLAAYEKLDKAEMNDTRADQLEKQRQQYERYANYCKAKVNFASNDYTSAKVIADEFFKTWGNGEAQAYLQSGLEKLYSIDINDLNRADPGLADRWRAVEDLLKKNFKGEPSRINAASRKKSLNEF